MIFLSDQLGSVTSQATQQCWSGTEIAEAAAERAQALIKSGVGPGDRVILRQQGSGSFFADLLAVWAAGAAAAVLNPGLTPDEIDKVIGHIEPKLALIDGGLDAARSMFSVPVIDFGAGTGPEDTHGVAERAASLDDPALILFTSGTTGTPKGVVHTFRSLVARFALNETCIGREDMGKTLCTLPVHFGHGLIGNCLTPLLHGGDVVLTKGSDIRSVAQLGATIDNYGITFMSSVPTLWKMALKMSEPPTGRTLRRVHVGSAPLSADLWSRIVTWAGTDNVVNMYGITETANWIGGASAADLKPRDGLVGRIWGGQAGVLGKDGRIRSQGIGEILIQCPSLMESYFRLEDLTAGALKDGWFHTGDIGRIDDGIVRLTGREKYEINRAGLKVHPEDIDILLERHEGVVEACAFGTPDPVAGEIVCVAVVLEPGLELSDLKTWCAERFVLRTLTADDLSNRFAGWLADPEVTEPINRPASKLTRETLARTVIAWDGIYDYQIGIFERESDKHVGNYMILIDQVNQRATFSVIIGDKDFWGRKVVLETRAALLDYFFVKRGIEKAIGSPLTRNFPAVFNYKAQGWKLEGVQRGHLKSQIGDGRLDLYQFALLKDEWLAIRMAERT